MTGDSVWVVDSFATLLPSQNYWVRASAARQIPYGGNFRTMTKLGSENGSSVWWLMPVSPTLGRESQEKQDFKLILDAIVSSRTVQAT